MVAPKSVLIIGASRGLGQALTQHYSKSIGASSVYATIRGDPSGSSTDEGIIIGGVDMSEESVGRDLVDGLKGKGIEKGELEVVYVVAGLLKTEEFGKSNWDDQVDMYKICAIAPVIVVEALVSASLLAPNAKIILITSEAGSLSFRTPEDGGGNYGHHGSKAAGNMAGRLLSHDLRDKGIVVVMVHPGFLKTEMTKAAGFEPFYEEMGAVFPDEAAEHLAKFVEGLDMSMTGKLWAPMGGRGIGNIKAVLGEEAAKQQIPLELPW